MLHYKILSTDTRAMPLNVSCEEFIAEWRSCWEDPKRDRALLLEMADPYFVHWESMVSDHAYPKDISYLSVYQHLENGYPKYTPTQWMRRWAREVRKLNTIKEELQLLFLEILSKMNYFPTQAHPQMAEFVIARFFKGYLQRRFTRTMYRPVDIRGMGTRFQDMGVEDIHADHLLLKNLGLTTWQAYLLTLASSGYYSASEIARITHTPTRTSIREEKGLWLSLKRVLLHEVGSATNRD